MKLFLIELRDKTAYIFSWLVVVWIIVYLAMGNQSIYINVLLQLFALSVIGALLLYIFFTSKLMKQQSFVKRLTCFSLSCIFIESGLIYKFQLYGIKTAKSLMIFILIAIIICVLPLGIFALYSRKTGKKYTDLLKTYQENNGIEEDT